MTKKLTYKEEINIFQKATESHLHIVGETESIYILNQNIASLFITRRLCLNKEERAERTKYLRDIIKAVRKLREEFS